MASSSRSNRSASGGNGTPSARCSRSYQAAPMPRKARPLLSTSKGGDGLGQQPGMPVGHPGDDGAQLQPAGLCRGEREGGVALEHRVVRGAEGLHLKPVVHDGEPGGADFVGGPGGLGNGRGERGRAAGHGEVHEVKAESHGPSVLLAAFQTATRPAGSVSLSGVGGPARVGTSAASISCSVRGAEPTRDRGGLAGSGWQTPRTAQPPVRGRISPSGLTAHDAEDDRAIMSWRCWWFGGLAGVVLRRSFATPW